ncbi:MAG: hypothetical protein ABIJ96_05940 [Elusimicrobiota bacterium]
MDVAKLFKELTVRAAVNGIEAFLKDMSNPIVHRIEVLGVDEQKPVHDRRQTRMADLY